MFTNKKRSYKLNRRRESETREADLLSQGATGVFVSGRRLMEATTPTVRPVGDIVPISNIEQEGGAVGGSTGEVPLEERAVSEARHDELADIEDAGQSSDPVCDDDGSAKPLAVPEPFSRFVHYACLSSQVELTSVKRKGKKSEAEKLVSKTNHMGRNSARRYFKRLFRSRAWKINSQVRKVGWYQACGSLRELEPSDLYLQTEQDIFEGLSIYLSTFSTL